MKSLYLSLVLPLLMLLAPLKFTLHASNVYITKTGHISFHSHTKFEDITAHNYQVSSKLNTETSEMAFVVLMKSFEFKNASMQEHFNDTYLESDKYPQASFVGKYVPVGGTTGGVTVTGNLTLHGITKPVTSTGTLLQTADGYKGTSTFDIVLADYGISVAAASQKVAEKVAIAVELDYKPKP